MNWSRDQFPINDCRVSSWSAVTPIWLRYPSVWIIFNRPSITCWLAVRKSVACTALSSTASSCAVWLSSTRRCSRSRKTLSGGLMQLFSKSIWFVPNWYSLIYLNTVKNIINICCVFFFFYSKVELPVEAFSVLGILEVLNIDDSQLTKIPTGAFASLEQLKEVRLSNANISTMEKDAFTGLGKLKLLDLHGNSLTDIPKGDFISFLINFNQLSSI